jgi:hypothetical protein
MTTQAFSLDKTEIQLLLQSLDHCLATCTKGSTSSTPCADCDRARKLRQKLADSLNH